MRQLIGITKFDKWHNEAVLDKLNTEYLSTKVERRRFEFYGHVARYPSERWANFLLDADLEEGAKKGRLDNWRKQLGSTLAEAGQVDCSFGRSEGKEVYKDVFDRIQSKRAGAVLSESVNPTM